MDRRALVIVWAQWRTLRNYFPRANKGGLAFAALTTAVWYGMWAFGAFGVFALTSDPESRESLRRFLPAGLFVAFLYWQTIPILMASTGSSLDLKKLMVYPIPHAQLFTIEVALRLTTAFEMAIMLTGAGLGLWWNPALPFWSPLILVPFAVMNLLFSAGLKELAARVFGRRRLREFAVIAVILLAALPQLLLLTNLSQKLSRLPWSLKTPDHVWPWGATAHIALGEAVPADWIAMLFWLAATYTFGRWQFERGLRFDEAAERATGAQGKTRRGWLETLYRAPGAIFRDPLAALVEKELRSLSRSPRFRLVFIMGFSFGLLIWLPLSFGRGRDPNSVMAANYLTFISVYALMLLSEVTIWNAFGFDRTAAQVYYVMPVKFGTVLRGKNIAAMLFVVIEVTVILLVCLLVRLPMTWLKIAEAYAVCLIFSIYLLAAGNISSLYGPKAVDPAKSWRSSGAGKFQAMLLLIYPFLALPILLAYGARYAFESEAAFYGVLGIAAILGGVVYWVAMDSAVSASDQKKEALLAALSRGEGPVA